MKTKVFALITALTFSITTIQPNRSEASGAGIVAGTNGLAGFAMLGAALGSGVLAANIIQGAKKQKNKFLKVLSYIGGVALFGLTVIMLEEKGVPMVQYSSMSEADIERLGISAADYAEYDANLPVINLINESITLDIAKKYEETKSFEGLDRLANDKWAEYGLILPVGANRVVETVKHEFRTALEAQVDRASK